MRTHVKLDPFDVRTIKEYADGSGRTIPSAIKHLTRQALAQHRSAMPALDDVDYLRAGPRSLAVHVNGDLSAAIRAFAESDGRSISSAMKVLLRDSLHRRGLLPTTTPTPTETAPTP